MIPVGIHYKVTWHYKGTTEVASANLNTYIQVPDGTPDGTSYELVRKAVEEDIEKFYPQEKYNVEASLKVLTINGRIINSYRGIIQIGDLTEIKARREQRRE